MRGAEYNPQPISNDVISTLLDTVAATAITLDYIDNAQKHNIMGFLPGLAPGVELLKIESSQVIMDCNEFIHRIGGIPVRTSLELDAKITGFTGFSEGVWTFRCKSPTGEELMTGSAQRLREVYSATLPDESGSPDMQ